MNEKIDQRLESQNYEKFAVTPRFCYFKPKTERQSTILEEVSFSLSQKKKFIHPKFFYDDTGSNLFEKICNLPEYYLARTEIGILNSIKSELPRYLHGNHALVELGSGSSIKTRNLLEILTSKQKDVEYYPIDISDILRDSSINLHDKYDNLKIIGIIDKYESGLQFIRLLDHTNKLVAFLGSSFGNFDPENGIEFLKKIRTCMREGDLFLLGIDLVKDVKILEEAYNDSQGMTADFNLNLLSRINKELDASFDQYKFEHVAIFNKKYKRIEMYLRSKVSQKVPVYKAGLLLRFKKGELVHTEYSYKYTITEIRKMAKKTGFKPMKIWTDKKKYFALAMFSI